MEQTGQVDTQLDLIACIWRFWLEALSIQRELGDPATITEGLIILGLTGDVESLIHLFVLLGSLALRRAEADVGATLVGAADVLEEEVGLVRTGAEAALHRNTVEELRQMLGDERFEKWIAEGRRMTLDNAVEYAFASID